MVLAGRMSLIMPQSLKLDKSTRMFDGCPTDNLKEHSRARNVKLAGGWALPLWKIWKSLGIIIPNWMEKYKSCSSHHQPGFFAVVSWIVSWIGFVGHLRHLQPLVPSLGVRHDEGLLSQQGCQQHVETDYSKSIGDCYLTSNSLEATNRDLKCHFFIIT